MLRFQPRGLKPRIPRPGSARAQTESTSRSRSSILICEEFILRRDVTSLQHKELLRSPNPVQTRETSRQCSGLAVGINIWTRRSFLKEKPFSSESYWNSVWTKILNSRPRIVCYCTANGVPLLRPNPHRTWDATRNAMQANGTC